MMKQLPKYDYIDVKYINRQLHNDDYIDMEHIHRHDKSMITYA